MSEKVILCIDDESIVLDSLREQLQQEFGTEYTIETAESGSEALEIFEDLQAENVEVPVIIADFIMPGMKGDELLENIHNLKPDPKKILLTGQASIQGVSNAVNKANLYRFISKPWDKDDLVLTVKEAIRSFYQDRTIIKQNEELKELNINLEKKVEERTLQLKELNATKDKFFSIIAHDLKNPFNTLMGFTELLLENLKEYPIDKVEEFIKILYDTSKGAYTLLENLLEWSRSQTGRIEMKPEHIIIKDLVDENINLLQNSASNKEIALVNKVDDKTKAFADANMIRTVLRNLISNAIKYTDNNGSVTITAKGEKDKIHITVTDTGLGIKPEDMEKLFRIDVNFSTHGTADESGTGLGLVLCKEFINKNKGSIRAESEYKKGSSFTISLPEKQ